MYCKLLLKWFSLLTVISQLQALKWNEPNVADGISHNDYDGLYPYNEGEYDVDQRRYLCTLPTTLDPNPLYSKDDLVTGDFKGENITVDNESITVLLCTSKYQGNQLLYISEGPDVDSLAVYAKLGDEDAKLIGVITEVNDPSNPFTLYDGPKY